MRETKTPRVVVVLTVGAPDHPATIAAAAQRQALEVQGGGGAEGASADPIADDGLVVTVRSRPIVGERGASKRRILCDEEVDGLSCANDEATRWISVRHRRRSRQPRRRSRRRPGAVR